jgi:bile acid:Na+ symporter, BASS family
MRKRCNLVNVGNIVGALKLSGLILPLLQIIMFGMGTELSVNEFKNIIDKQKRVVIGTICHYTIRPVLSFTLASVFEFPKEIAAGIILMGCCPSGLASNAMSYFARANLALSKKVTMVSTILALFFTPFLLLILGGELIEINFGQWQGILPRF